MSNHYVRYQRIGDTARITLTHAKRHNALVPALLDDLLNALENCRQDPPRVLVLDAEGASFSSGGDVRAFFTTARSERVDYAKAVVGRLNRTILTLLELPCPTIAAVQGLVTGGSLGLVLASDVVVASTRATFAPWYTVVGFSPDGGWSNLMGQRIGPSRALEIQLTNRTITAQQALDYGLAHYLADHDAFPGKVADISDTLCHRQPGSVRHTLTLNRPDLTQTAAQLQREYEHFLAQITTDEAHLGMAKFLERAP